MSLLITIDAHHIHFGPKVQPLPMGHKFYKLHRHKGYVNSIFSFSKVFKMYSFLKKKWVFKENCEKFIGSEFKLNNDTLFRSSHNLGKRDMMTFEDLREMLEEFENYLPEEEKEMAQVIQAEIESNG